MRPNTLESVLARAMPEPNTGCWIWVGVLGSAGYGQVSWKSKAVSAHRVVYEEIVGPPDPDKELDHLCRMRQCVNPRHLEQVTSKINVLRGDGPTARNLRKDQCAHGHIFSAANTFRDKGGRGCKACRRFYRKAAHLAHVFGLSDRIGAVYPNTH